MTEQSKPILPVDTGTSQKVYVLHYDNISTPEPCKMLVGVYNDNAAAHEAVVKICATPESRLEFWYNFNDPHPAHITASDFRVEPFPLLRGKPLLDDWHQTVDGKYHPGWDHEKVLTDNNVTVEWSHQMTDGEGTVSECPPDLCGWAFSWKHGAIHIGRTTEAIARKASALFVRLWQLGVAASFCDKLMDGFICYLERQENTSLTFLAEIDRNAKGAFAGIQLTREGMFDQCFLDDLTNEKEIIDTLAPAEDEEVIVTFAKRKRPQQPGEFA